MLEQLKSGRTVQVFDQLDSTNLEARLQFASGVTEERWLLAKKQTAGYGRQKRQWSQFEGNLAATLLLPVDAKMEAIGLHLFSFVTAISVREAIQEFTDVQVQLKWPNDVLVNGGKVSGLLLELCDQSNKRALSIGIGVNLSAAPAIEEYRTTSLSAHLSNITPPTPQVFLEALDEKLFENIGLLVEEGFSAIRKKWLSHAYGIGEQLTARLPNETLEGIFEGIDEEGVLLLRDGLAIHKINSADVFFPRLKP